MRHSSVLALALLCTSATVFAQSAPVVTEAPLRAHLAYLADDLLEGRGTGQRGGELTIRYLEAQAQAIGLKPLTGKSFRLPVSLIGTQTLPTTSVRFSANGTTLTPVLGKDIVLGTGGSEAKVHFDAPVVFVGYGISAPEERWDDYQGVDVKGKLLIMMVNDPKPTAEEPNRFGGKSLTFTGRWTYKFEEALRRGAAGVLLIHTTESASYPWSVPAAGMTIEQFHLAGPGNAFQGWLHEDMARTLFKAAGKDLDALRAQAEVRGFKPVELGVTVQAALDSKVREVQDFNVAGMVPGSDPRLKDQAVVYTAHWDHLGIGEQDGKPDHIWNGAVDNASGTAALVAMAQAAVARPAKRTQIFLWVCAEEKGLLGSMAYVRAPAWPLAKTVVNLNLDSMNFVGKTRDIAVPLVERSTLRSTAALVAERMGLRLSPPSPDPAGSYFRSDHYNFAKAGVPAFRVGASVFSGDGNFEFANEQAASQAKIRDFKGHYHQVSDQYDPNWDLSGMVQQAQFMLNLGYEVANGATVPVYNKDDPLAKVKR